MYKRLPHPTWGKQEIHELTLTEFRSNLFAVEKVICSQTTTAQRREAAAYAGGHRGGVMGCQNTPSAEDDSFSLHELHEIMQAKLVLC